MDDLLSKKLIALMSVVLLVQCACTEKPQYESAVFRQFKDIYEPSGVQWVPGAGVVLIEDEQELLPRLLQFNDLFIVNGASPLFGLPVANDLEGIAASGDGVVYAITSHSIRSGGKRDISREKLLKFTLHGGTAVVDGAADSLRDDLIAAFPQIGVAIDALPQDTRRFNIESLAFHQSQPSLLIGFRSPLLDGQVIVAQLDNPAAYSNGSEPAVFAEKLILIDLDGGGIRAMAFDETLDGYLIVTRVENSGDDNFALWLWKGGDKARQLRVKTLSNLSKLEGISPVTVNGKTKLLLVFDDGDADSNRPGHYAIADYSLIEPYNR